MTSKRIGKFLLKFVCWTGLAVIMLWNSCIGLALSENLFMATCDREYERMGWCLSFGADVNYIWDGTSALQVAIEDDDPKAASILLLHGAEPRVLNDHFLRIMRSPRFSHALAERGYKIPDWVYQVN